MTQAILVQIQKRVPSMSRRSFHGKPCPYCRRQMNLNDFHLQPTADHIVPQSMGGRKTIICCLKCNNLKADMLPEVWAAFMAANPGWWKHSREERKARRLNGPYPLPAEHSQYILKHGKKAYREWVNKPQVTIRSPVIVPPEYIWPNGEHHRTTRSERMKTITPELIRQTIEHDARLR